MTCLLSMPLLRRASVFAAAILLAAGVTQAQTTTSNDASGSSSYSSSQSGLTQTQLAALMAPALPAPGGSAAPSGGAAAGQYGSSGGGNHGFLHNRSWTFEAGGGFNAPMGNDIPYITWGGNFTGGGGLRFNNRLSVLAEYQFMDDKLPGPFISAFSNDGATAGNSHINSITGSPVVNLFPKKSNGIYLVGGFGWYHKSTNLNATGFCSYYYGCSTVTVASISSNQWGGNAGLGLYHRLGNMYGDSSHTELFAEARYTYIHTPALSQNGLGTTELIPVTLGFRF